MIFFFLTPADSVSCDRGSPRKKASTETGSTSRHGSRPLSLSLMSQTGPTPTQPRKVPVPPTRCGRVFGRGGGGSHPLYLHICMCESAQERCTSVTQLPCNIITHKRGIPGQKHICSQYEALSQLGSQCEKFPIYGVFGGVLITTPGHHCL